MVGILLSVGSGFIQPAVILNLLQNPKHDTWPPGVTAAVAEGLFLKSVNYKNMKVLRGYLSWKCTKMSEVEDQADSLQAQLALKT